jgi:hypothetical protein
MSAELLELDVYNKNLRYMDEDARRGAEVDEVLRQRKEAHRSTPWGQTFQTVWQSLFPRRTVPSR